MNSLQLKPREPPKVEDEQTVFTKLTAEFNKLGVPGGLKLVMPETADFFANLKAGEERTDETTKKNQGKEVVSVRNRGLFNLSSSEGIKGKSGCKEDSK